MRDFLAEFVHKKITGGVDIYASHWPDWPRERTAIIVHAGILQDKKGLEGTAHLLEHLITYGGKARGDDKMYEFFQKPGGDIDQATRMLATKFNFFGPPESNHLAKSLDLASGFLFKFPANKKLLKKEKEIVGGELRKKYSMQCALNNEIRENKILFSKTPLERCILPHQGLPETIDAISAADLSDWHRQYYVPANISIVAAGGLPIKEVFRLIAASPFSVIGGERVKLTEPLAELPPLTENRFDFKLGDYIKKVAGINTSRLRISAALPGTISEKALDLCCDMILAAMNQEIRERLHLSYGCTVEYACCKALHTITMELDDLSPGSLMATKQLAKSVLACLSDNKKAFEAKKQKLLNQMKLVDYNVDGLTEDAIDELTQNQRLPTRAQLMVEMEAVTMKDVRKVFSHLTRDRLWIMTQRP